MNIKEVARAAQVSPSTVSRVMNNPDLVKSDTREKVHAAIEAVGYSLPKSGTTSRKHVIGLAVPNMALDYIGELVRELERVLEETPYDLLLVNMKRERNVSRYFRENTAFRKKIDALILFSSVLDNECVDFFRSLELPVVLMQSRCERERSISTNNYLGALDATNFLIQRGYRKIGFIGWEPENNQVLERYNGCKNALEKAGLNLSAQCTRFVPLSKTEGYRATEEMLSSEKPEAIFYAADSLAFGGYQYCREHQLRIPEDIGLIGFDDIELASVIGLTTMQQFFSVKIEMAVSYLLDRLSGEIPEPLEEEFCVTPRLVVRNSTR